MENRAVGRRRVAFLFPGQGAQYSRMAADLYGVSPGFTTTMDQAFAAFGPALRADWLAASPSPLFDDGSRSQPLLYAVGYGLGKLLMDSGVRPDVLLGHSVGELVAATLAGVFDFASGLRFLDDAVRAFAGAPAGGMLAVAATVPEVRPYLREDVVIGAVNAERQLLLAGSDPYLAAVESALQADQFVCARARAKQPFHSPAMKNSLNTRALDPRRQIRPRRPRTPVYSAYLGALLDDETATDVNFWIRQPTRPVLFGPALNRMVRTGDHLLVEPGPGQSLTTLARRLPAVAGGRSAVIPASPPRRGAPGTDLKVFRDAIQRLRDHGHVPDGAGPDF